MRKNPCCVHVCDPVQRLPAWIESLTLGRMTSAAQLRAQFVRALERDNFDGPHGPDGKGGAPEAQYLARLALWVAATYDDQLDVDGSLAQLIELGEQAAEFGVVDADSLAEFLAEKCGFVGNRKDYYRIENSCLNQVIEQRIGIPITLAIVYLAVGRQVGLDVNGISFPGHFMVGVREGKKSGVRENEDSTLQLLDPFSGRRISQSDCLQQLDQMLRARGLSAASAANAASKAANEDASLAEQLQGYLQPAKPRQILLRLLENLKQIHLEQRDLPRVLLVQDYQILLDPHNFDLRHQREQYLARSAGRSAGETNIH